MLQYLLVMEMSPLKHYAPCGNENNPQVYFLEFKIFLCFHKLRTFCNFHFWSWLFFKNVLGPYHWRIIFVMIFGCRNRLTDSLSYFPQVMVVGRKRCIFLNIFKATYLVNDFSAVWIFKPQFLICMFPLRR